MGARPEWQPARHAHHQAVNEIPERNSGLIVLDPTSERGPRSRPRAHRLNQLAGSTIALLDISKPRGDVFLEGLATLLEERGARIARFRKPTYTKTASPDLRREIHTKCAAVIEALAD